jgi:hypothetical protein
MVRGRNGVGGRRNVLLVSIDTEDAGDQHAIEAAPLDRAANLFFGELLALGQ